MSQVNMQIPEFIKILEKVKDIKYKLGGSRFDSTQRAIDTLMVNQNNINSIEKLQELKNIGKSTITKYKEFINTGTLKMIEDFKANPLNIFNNVYGIGPKKAMSLVKDSKISTIAELRKNHIPWI